MHNRRKVDRRYRTASVELSRWGAVFADDKLAGSIIDRVVHYDRLVKFCGHGYRLKKSLMLRNSGSCGVPALKPENL